MPSDYDLFNKLIPEIKSLPQFNELTKSDLFIEKFRRHSSNYKGKQIEIYYIPFDYINEKAKVTLIGITPGWTQMEIAYRKANLYLNKGLSPEEVLIRVCDDASFAGTMRTNLVNMLDGVELAAALEIESCNLFFEERGRDYAHTTSAIRYPVFIDGEDYRGSSPSIVKYPILKEYVTGMLAQELQSTHNALIIPLGKAASEAVQLLISIGAVERERCLIGFPHPSGANGHRVKQYNQNKQLYTDIVKNWFDNH